MSKHIKIICDDEKKVDDIIRKIDTLIPIHDTPNIKIDLKTLNDALKNIKEFKNTYKLRVQTSSNIDVIDKERIIKVLDAYDKTNDELLIDTYKIWYAIDNLGLYFHHLSFIRLIIKNNLCEDVVIKENGNNVIILIELKSNEYMDSVVLLYHINKTTKAVDSFLLIKQNDKLRLDSIVSVFAIGNNTDEFGFDDDQYTKYAKAIRQKSEDIRMDRYKNIYASKYIIELFNDFNINTYGKKYSDVKSTQNWLFLNASNILVDTGNLYVFLLSSHLVQVGFDPLYLIPMVLFRDLFLDNIINYKFFFNPVANVDSISAVRYPIMLTCEKKLPETFEVIKTNNSPYMNRVVLNVDLTFIKPQIHNYIMISNTDEKKMIKEYYTNIINMKYSIIEILSYSFIHRNPENIITIRPYHFDGFKVDNIFKRFADDVNKNKPSVYIEREKNLW